MTDNVVLWSSSAGADGQAVYGWLPVELVFSSPIISFLLNWKLLNTQSDFLTQVSTGGNTDGMYNISNWTLLGNLKKTKAESSNFRQYVLFVCNCST